MSAVPTAVSSAPARIAYDPICPGFGVDVSGIDMAQPLTDTPFASRSAALVAQSVLVFPHHLHLTPATNVAFGRRLGELEVEPFRDTVVDLPIFVSPGYGAERWIETWHIDLICQEKQ